MDTGMDKSTAGITRPQTMLPAVEIVPQVSAIVEPNFSEPGAIKAVRLNPSSSSATPANEAYRQTTFPNAPNPEAPTTLSGRVDRKALPPLPFTDEKSFLEWINASSQAMQQEIEFDREEARRRNKKCQKLWQNAKERLHDELTRIRERRQIQAKPK